MSGGERSPEERLSAYLDGELSPVERSEVERALDGSESLRRQLAELAALDELARERPEDVVAPEAYFETLPGRVRERLPGRARRAGPPSWVWPAAAAVVIAAALPTLRGPEPARSVAPAPSLPEPPVFASPPPEPAPSPSRPEAAPREPAAPAASTEAPPKRPAAAPTPEPSIEPTRAPARGGPVRSLAGAPAQLADRRLAMERAPEKDETDDGAFEELLERDATTVAELRELREAWRAFADAHPGARADEARVRLVELGLDAYRLGRDPADLQRARQDAAAYLVGPSSPRVERVRRRLEEAE